MICMNRDPSVILEQMCKPFHKQSMETIKQFWDLLEQPKIEL